ncbi:group II intron maturase-specific domain-containing protein [Candidatus Kuenenia stuttgartensis]|uniref:group II intron maturase-specific domain-containing protein n=1 Tax=Kuenenia stuttgartiensis TaxID=174633 RepID=UPI00146B92C2
MKPVIRGHVNYFRLGNVQKVYRSLDCWVRMRLRCFKFSENGEQTTSVSLFTDSLKWGYSHSKENFLRRVLKHDV